MRRDTLTTAIVALLTLAPLTARSHGVLGHVHVTGWAIENLEPGELSELFSDPQVRDAALFGAAFPDSGYAPDVIGQGTPAARAYAEHAHWEPFVESYIQWMRRNDPPPFVTLESRKRAAFLLGVAAHGMQDEVFDSMFLDQVAFHDGPDDPQGEADPGTDGFLAVDDLLRFTPSPYVPEDVLLPLFEPLDEEITSQTMAQGIDLISVVYLHPTRGPRLAESLAREHGPNIPWTRDHYLDPDVPASLRAEIRPTMRYMQSVWDRLHGRWDEAELVAHAYPSSPRRLRSHVSGTPDARASMVFGVGVRARDASTSLADASGAPLAHTSRGTRWGGPDGWSRVLRVDPDSDLEPGARYTVTLEPGAELVTGARTERAHAHTFQVACVDPQDPSCPELTDLPEYAIEPPMDEADAGAPDAGAQDAGAPDAGSQDQLDAGATDEADATAPTTGSGGASSEPGGCRHTPARPPAPHALWLLGLVAALTRGARARR